MPMGDDSFMNQDPLPGNNPQGQAPAPMPNTPMPDSPLPETPTDEQPEQEGGKDGIQQMAGQLSQMIRDYNSEQPQPDVETNKFAAGMVIAAAIKDLDEKDRKDILKKLKAGEFDEVQENPEPQMEEPVAEGKCYTKRQLKKGVK